MGTDNMDEKSPLIKPAAGTSTEGGDGAKAEGSVQSSSCTRRLCSYLSKVTVEPAVFLHFLAYAVEGVFVTNLFTDKICTIDLHFDQDVCDHLDEHDEEQDEVQRLVSTYTMYQEWAELLPAMLVMLYLGTLSDTRSRKLPLLLPLTGFSIKALGLCLNIYWWGLQPYYLLLCYLPYGLSGTFVALLMAASAYISENSNERARSTQISLLLMMLLLCMPIGHILSIFLYNRMGYMGIFGTEFILSLISVLYVLVRIRDKKPNSDLNSARKEGQERGILWRLKETLTVALRRRENGVRGRILGYVCGICLDTLAAGSMHYMYLYTMKKFDWDYYSYTVWSTMAAPVTLVCSVVLMPLLSYRWQVADSLLCFGGSASHLFYWVILATAPHPTVLYLSTVALLGSGLSTAARGALSKLVAADELGAVFSLVALGETALPLASSFLYTFLYNVTLDTFPGTFLLVSASLSLLSLFIFTWLAATQRHPA